LVSGDPDPARRQLVQVLRLPVQEAILLEVLHVCRDLVERQAEPFRQAVTRMQIGHGRGLVVDLPVLEQDSSLQIHWVVPSTERRRGVASGRGLKHTPRKMATAYHLWQRCWRPELRPGQTPSRGGAGRWPAQTRWRAAAGEEGPRGSWSSGRRRT